MAIRPATLTVNEDIKNRVTYSVLMQKMAPDSLTDFIRGELDKVALAHSTFTDDALALIVRSSEGVLRRVKNLCLDALLEAVRDRTKIVDLSKSIASSSSRIGGRRRTRRTSGSGVAAQQRAWSRRARAARLGAL